MSNPKPGQAVAHAKFALGAWMAMVLVMAVTVLLSSPNEDREIRSWVGALGPIAIVLLLCVLAWKRLGEARSPALGIGVVSVYSGLGAVGMLVLVSQSSLSGWVAVGAGLWGLVVFSGVIAIRAMLRVPRADESTSAEDLSAFD